jgi:DNA ligase (NAD+)
MNQEITDFNYLVELSDAYYSTGTPLVSDDQFDKLCEIYETKYKKPFQYLGKATHSKINLPVPMPSLQKSKDEHAIGLFLNRNSSKQFLVSSKVDGISCLLVSSNKEIKLMTRGDGTVGTDISHLVPFLKLPKKIHTIDIIIRGELVLPLPIFISSFQNIAENPRNLVSGWINGKHINPLYIKQLQFIGHSIPGLDIYSAFKKMKQLNITSSYYTIIPREEITEQHMRKLITDYPSKVNYEMDGLVISSCDVVEQLTIDNPKMSIAFKVQKETIQTRVLYIEWQTSRYGMLCPKAVLEPVKLSGVTISNATAFHAKYVEENNLGPDSIITITRSGDVIPYIVSVDTSTKASFPSSYEWANDIHIRIPKENQERNKEMIISSFEHCMDVLDLKGVKGATLLKLYESGITTLEQLFTCSKEQLLLLEGIKDKSATNIYSTLQKGKEKINVVNLLLFSNYFQGFGEKKINIIYENMGDKIVQILTKQCELSPKELTIDLFQLGIKTLSSTFIEGLQKCRDRFSTSYLLTIALDHHKNRVVSKHKHTEVKHQVVFSGFRDDVLKKKLEEAGYKVSETVSKHTTLLLVKDIQNESSKTKKATELGIQIQNVSDFKLNH